MAQQTIFKRTAFIVTGNYAATVTDDLLQVNLSAAATITFPAIYATSQVITIKRIDAGAFTLTMLPNGTDTFEGQTSFRMAAGGAAITFYSDPATGTWRNLNAFIPATAHGLYYPISVKAGDTLTNPTTETAFASKYTVPANYLTVGQKVYYRGKGRYMITTGTLSPAATAKIKLGAITLITTGALNIGVGTGTEYGFTFEGGFTVQSVGATGTVQADASLTFILTGGGAPTSASIIVSNPPITIDTTATADLTAAVTFSPGSASPASYFKLTDFDVSTSKKPTAAN